jgi:hypothetical protein
MRDNVNLARHTVLVGAVNHDSQRVLHLRLLFSRSRNLLSVQYLQPLGRPRRRWVDNIKMDLREIGWDGMEWIGLIWLRIGTVEGSCQHGNEPSGSIKCWEFLESLHNWQLLKKGSAP